jgi:UDP-glucose 4-epimerase
MSARRVLITGVSTFWGGRLAQALERDPSVEAVIGVSPDDPTLELDRTEFVRVGTQHALLRRIVRAAEIDTVVDTRLLVDSTTAPARAAHENNVIGTMNILAACGGAGSPVRKVVFKSSAHYYGSDRDDPAFFTEDMERPHPPRTALERDVVEAERAVEAFAARHPEVTVSVLRFANALGPDLTTSHTRLLALPAVPSILGFDPRYQFIHEHDIHGVLEHATRHALPGVYNAAGDGVLALSEVASLLGKPLAPVLPPWGTGLAATTLRTVGVRIPPEMLQQLRYGRGLDNRKLKAAGYSLRATSREAVLALGRHLRTRAITDGDPGYRYEREVEEFLRWSPSVRGSDSLGLERLSPEQLAELARALDSLPGGRPEPS